MAAPSPAFQFYPKDWLSSMKIMRMTPAQEGAYIRLLAYCWEDEDCGIPDDHKTLALLSRLGQGWFKGGSRVVRDCFIPHPDVQGKLTHKKLLDARAKQREWKIKSSMGGKKSARMKRLNREAAKATTQDNAEPSVNPDTPSNSKGGTKGGSRVVEDCLQPNLNSSSSSSSSSSPPRRRNPERDCDASRRAESPEPSETRSRSPRVKNAWWDETVEAFPEILNPEVKSHRSRIGKLSKEFKALCGDKLSPTEIPTRLKRMQATFEESSMCTPEALVKHWGSFGPSWSPPGKSNGRGRRNEFRKHLAEVKEKQARQEEEDRPRPEQRAVQEELARACEDELRKNIAKLRVTPTRQGHQTSPEELDRMLSRIDYSVLDGPLDFPKADK